MELTYQEQSCLTLGFLKQQKNEGQSEKLTEFLIYATRKALTLARLRGFSLEDAEDLAADARCCFWECLSWGEILPLVAGDFKDVERFVGKIKERSNAMSRFLYESFPEGFRERLDLCDGAHPPDEELEESLAQELNHIMMRHDLTPYSSHLWSAQDGDPLTRTFSLKQNRRLLTLEFASYIYRTPNTYDPRTPALHFYNRIVFNKIRRNYSGEDTAWHRSLRSLDEDSDVGGATLGDSQASSSVTPDKVVALRDAIARCREHLSDMQRKYVDLHVERYTLFEISKITGEAPDVVRGRVPRTIKKLKSCLETNGVNRKYGLIN